MESSRQEDADATPSAAAADNDNYGDNNGDSDGGEICESAEKVKPKLAESQPGVDDGGNTRESEVKVKPKLAESQPGVDDGWNTRDSEVKVKLASGQPGIDTGPRGEFVEAERHSATLFVGRLSHFIASTLVRDVTSPLDVDRSLQQFASNFCTGDFIVLISSAA